MPPLLPRRSRGGGPSPAQTNSSLSLKAMNSVQTGHRKQAGPADGELVAGLSNLCGDGCPPQLFGWPFSLPPMDDLQDPGPGSCCPSVPVELQSQASPPSTHWSHGAHCLPGSCFYQLNMHGGHFVPAEPDCSTAEDEAGSSHGLQVEFRLSPSASPPSSAALPSHFQTFSSLLHAPPVQHPRSLTQ